MAVLKKLVLGVVGLVVALLAIGLVLPSHQTVQRSAVYDAKPAAVYAYLNGFRRFNEWSPWAALDPNTRYTLEGPPIGVGAKQSWASKDPNVGTGSQEIVEVQPYSLIKSKLQFGGWDGVSLVSLIIAPEGAGTKLTWSMDSDLGKNPVNRWFGVFLDKMVGKDYDKGLANLKPQLEGLPKDEIDGIALVLAKTESSPYLFISDSAGVDAAGSKLAAAYGRLSAFLQANAIKPAAAPIALTRSYDEKTAFWEFDAGIPIGAGTPPAPADTGIQYGQTYAGYTLRATHIGPHTAMEPSYAKLMAYRTAAGLRDAAGAWEQYENDMTTTPEDKLITQIYWPVK